MARVDTEQTPQVTNGTCQIQTRNGGGSATCQTRAGEECAIRISQPLERRHTTTSRSTPADARPQVRLQLTHARLVGAQKRMATSHPCKGYGSSMRL